jgi:hypothetical protein
MDGFIPETSDVQSALFIVGWLVVVFLIIMVFRRNL